MSYLGHPELASGIEESRDLGDGATVSGGDDEDKSIVLLEIGSTDDRVGELGWSVHLSTDLIAQGLGAARSGGLVYAARMSPDDDCLHLVDRDFGTL